MNGIFTVTTDGIVGLIGAAWLGFSALIAFRFPRLIRRHAKPRAVLIIGRPPTAQDAARQRDGR